MKHKLLIVTIIFILLEGFIIAQSIDKQKEQLKGETRYVEKV